MRVLLLCGSNWPDHDNSYLNLVCRRDNLHEGDHWETENGPHWTGGTYGAPLYQLVPEDGDGAVHAFEAMQRFRSLPDVTVTLTGTFEDGG